MRDVKLLRILLGIGVTVTLCVAAVISFTFLAAALQPVGSERLVWLSYGVAATLGFIGCAWSLWRIRQFPVRRLALVYLVSTCLVLPACLLLTVFARTPP